MNAASHITPRQRLARVIHFFPFTLLWLHFKRNHFLLLLWLMLFGFTTGFIGEKYGVLHQFLYPEYIESSSYISFSFIGFSLGGFIMAFNLYTYILHGYRFPFIATLNRPFIKFSLNNFIIPLIYVLVFLSYSYDYQKNQELLSGLAIIYNLLGFLSGLFLFLGITWVYFNSTNVNAAQVAENKAKNKDESKENPIKSTIHKKKNWKFDKSKNSGWRVETYIQSFTSIRLARESDHYDKATLQKVFSQNHFNASLFEVLLVLSFIAVGFFGESSFFAIPAGASGILFFTVIMMIISALFSWIKGWTLTVLLGLFLFANYWSTSVDFLKIPNQAYGLDYTMKPADCSPERVMHLIDEEFVKEDRAHMIEILENWKKKVSKHLSPGEKPKFLIVNCSGGGSRSALWTMSTLIALHKATDEEFLDQVFMINGSSGGMFGAAYLRELVLRNKINFKLEVGNEGYIDYSMNIAKDLLNPVMFSLATNDMFFRFKDYEYNGHSYTKDRGFAFEDQLHTNTDNILRKKLKDYRDEEYKANIPLMIMAPTITNDGRRLLISPQPLSFMSKSSTKAAPEDLEFLRLFKDQGAEDLAFSSALRMNATFPYILPVVSLPSDPPISIMDAGLRDNYGLKTTFEFISEFKDWINKNTSGVLIVQTRDLPENYEKKRKSASLIQSFSEPLGSVYDNFINTQRYSNDQFYRYLKTSFDDIELVTLHLNNSPEMKVSLSWHLTKAEKNAIYDGLKKEEFLQKIEEVKTKLKSKK